MPRGGAFFGRIEYPRFRKKKLPSRRGGRKESMLCWWCGDLPAAPPEPQATELLSAREAAHHVMAYRGCGQAHHGGRDHRRGSPDSLDMIHREAQEDICVGRGAELKRWMRTVRDFGETLELLMDRAAEGSLKAVGVMFKVECRQNVLRSRKVVRAILKNAVGGVNILNECHIATKANYLVTSRFFRFLS